MQKQAITGLNAPNGSEIFHYKVRNWARWISPFCRFSASFSIKCDVTDAILQDNEKMKVQYLRSLLFDLFETLRLLELGKGILLHFKFCCYGNQNQNYFILLKTQKVYCLSKSDVYKVI